MSASTNAMNYTTHDTHNILSAEMSVVACTFLRVGDSTGAYVVPYPPSWQAVEECTANPQKPDKCR